MRNLSACFSLTLFARNTDIFMTSQPEVCSVHTPRSVCVCICAFETKAMKERLTERSKMRL